MKITAPVGIILLRLLILFLVWKLAMFLQEIWKVRDPLGGWILIGCLGYLVVGLVITFVRKKWARIATLLFSITGFVAVAVGLEVLVFGRFSWARVIDNGITGALVVGAIAAYLLMNRRVIGYYDTSGSEMLAVDSR
jgi:uncharacterized YccA/Bax inhibitor family protein